LFINIPPSIYFFYYSITTFYILSKLIIYYSTPVLGGIYGGVCERTLKLASADISSLNSAVIV